MTSFYQKNRHLLCQLWLHLHRETPRIENMFIYHIYPIEFSSYTFWDWTSPFHKKNPYLLPVCRFSSSLHALFILNVHNCNKLQLFQPTEPPQASQVRRNNISLRCDYLCVTFISIIYGRPHFLYQFSLSYMSSWTLSSSGIFLFASWFDKSTGEILF